MSRCCQEDIFFGSLLFLICPNATKIKNASLHSAPENQSTGNVHHIEATLLSNTPPPYWSWRSTVRPHKIYTLITQINSQTVGFGESVFTDRIKSRRELGVTIFYRVTAIALMTSGDETRWPNDDSMVGQRLRRWPGIEPSLGCRCILLTCHWLLAGHPCSE